MSENSSLHKKGMDHYNNLSRGQLELTMFTCGSKKNKLMLVKVASHENGTCLLIRIGCRVSLSCLMPVLSPSETGGFGLCKRMCHQSF